MMLDTLILLFNYSKKIDNSLESDIYKTMELILTRGELSFGFMNFDGFQELKHKL